ncbi:zinc ribbon domain-containing protein [Treponema zioleckii]|uniref:zinc ribbon domain-containing protein n=1 Tax=Treponema zioleckii TaxID=331680 RepID=UPI00168BF866|nr:zinc ribbon domain-containing protein [Treponema zioleckii]
MSTAKFFCESCGAEVPANSKFCRHCGRFFSSVRCPVCGLTGSNEKFKNGCPNCGYAIPGKNGKTYKEKNHISRATKKNLFRQLIQNQEMRTLTTENCQNDLY